MTDGRDGPIIRAPVDDARRGPPAPAWSYRGPIREVVMKVKVLAEDCIGCGQCAEDCPNVFEMDGRVATVIADHLDVREEDEDDCRHAAEDCPSEAIIIDEEER